MISPLSSFPTAGSTHVPVLVREVVEGLGVRAGGIYLDGTFGAGGYASAILGEAECSVLGIDRDPFAVDRGEAVARRYPGRLTVVRGRYGDMDALLAERGLGPVDGVALDIGTSSMQIDDPARGFSFLRDGPLDMRMEREGESAADAVNILSEDELTRIIRDYGEERMARRVARAIVAARAEEPITRTGRLASVVRSAVRKSEDGIDPATRTFQALRIHVNDELGELERGLDAAERVLAPGGRLAVVSFHSLEDRIVKSFLRNRSGNAPRGSRHFPDPARPTAPTFQAISRRAIRPGAGETAANPRARSARLRIAERTSAPAWPHTIPQRGPS